MNNEIELKDSLSRILGDGYEPSSWLCYALKNKPMLRINLNTISEIVSDIRRLNDLPAIEEANVLNYQNDYARLSILLVALKALDALLASKELLLRLSKKEALELKRVTFDLLREPGMLDIPNADTEKLKKLRSDVLLKAKEFDSAFKVELQDFHTYIIPQTGLNNVNVLIESAEDMFGESVKKKLNPSALENAHEAGKCLAFNLPTACGFYIIRAVECVIVSYLEFLEIPSEKINKNRNWGRYEDLLRDFGGEDKIIRLINTIRIHHRNPIMHPTDTLTSDEADTLLQICRTLIQSICKFLPDYAPKLSQSVLSEPSPKALLSQPSGSPSHVKSD